MIARKIFFCITLFVLLSTVVVQCKDDIDKYLIFRLYTREQPDDYQQLNIDDLPEISTRSFHPNRPTRIYVHGFRGHEKGIIRYKDAYLNLGDFNFIAVDWTKGAKTFNYWKAKGRVRKIAEKLGRLLVALVIKRDLNLQNVTIVGHSLGAHISGRSGKFIQRLRRPIGRIACIIGLDPASVGFHLFEPEKRLAIGDADYVQVIHTDGSKFGLPYPMGNADFYPNGGRKQPGCPKNIVTSLIDECSHTRAHQLFLESLTVNFTALYCGTITQVINSNCVFDQSVGKMGGDITAHSAKPYGIFYLETKNNSLYFMPEHNIRKRHVALDFGIEESSENESDTADYTECFTSF